MGIDNIIQKLGLTKTFLRLSLLTPNSKDTATQRVTRKTSNPRKGTWIVGHGPYHEVGRGAARTPLPQQAPLQPCAAKKPHSATINLGIP